MKWPYISRVDHDAIMEAMKSNLDARIETIKALELVVKDRDEQLNALLGTLMNQKCNDYTPVPTPGPKMVEISTPKRSGWRARAEMASNATRPKVRDSAVELEERVKAQGGK